MIEISHVFSDGALYQADSELTLWGLCEPYANVACKIYKDEAECPVSLSESRADADGRFSVTVNTPAPSFDEYKISLVCGFDEKIIQNVLFGEVWLASGQSNMELQNVFIVGHENLFDEIKAKQIRVFHVEYPSDGSIHNFPYEPDNMSYGFWMNSDDSARLNNVSAAGLKFAADIYDFLNQNANVPVGLLNSSWGATSIFAWIPKDYAEEDERVAAVLKKINAYPDKESWNTKGGGNFNQCSAQYNFKIAPLLGLKMRGVIWYQGENECIGEFENRIYADYLRCYHRAYSKEFAADPGNFMMISSLLYPWAYTGESDCYMGYLNAAFVETAAEAPDKFAFAPIHDFEPVWSYHRGNHPIHPTNKYEVGSRLANLAIANSYNGGGQKSPAYLESWRVENNRIRLKFASVGSGLYIGDKNPKRRVHGLYVAGEDNIYLPAEYKIISDDTLEVWCDEINDVKNACYSFQSLDMKCNVFAGEYPVAPFATDTETFFKIEPHRWYDSSEDVIWADKIHDAVLDLFYHPMWNPTPNSEVCRDTAFCTDTTASIRVCSDEKEYGCYTNSYIYNKLDLGRFAALEVNFYNADKAKAVLVLEGEFGQAEIPFEKIGEPYEGWVRYSASLSNVPDGEIKRMIFKFTDQRNDYHFVNFEKIRLIKK